MSFLVLQPSFQNDVYSSKDAIVCYLVFATFYHRLSLFVLEKAKMVYTSMASGEDIKKYTEQAL